MRTTGEPAAPAGDAEPRAELTEERRAFLSKRGFPLDPFQERALDILDAGSSVLVAAPTGSGKTVVAEYAVARALRRGQRAIYTTPLKALSNQKYRDFIALYGEERVGLLTGDVSVNGDASVVIMTTEVLRNMIYAARDGLDALGCVVLDEVHYLADRYRGSVWEEIILSAPEHIVLVSLSATVSNAEELARWIEHVRGSTRAVIEDERPITLEHLYVVGNRRTDRLDVFPTFVNGRPNRDAAALDARFDASAARHGRGGRGSRGRAESRAGGPSRPRRSDVVEHFAGQSLLPAIYFVFSRLGCDDAVRQCLDDGVRLTSSDEREEIREIADRHVERLSDGDLGALHYGRFRHGLESGIASHHGGMVPPFRETVEELFGRALVKVVFATETLALGVNMPARSVIIENLSKFGGSGHSDLTPGEYTQLTGRAGRRGIDVIGYAAALWSPLHRFGEVAVLASARASALRSSFRPSYNMVVNLVRNYDRPSAYRLVRSSFAQYLSDVPLAAELDAVAELLSERGYLAGWHVTDAGMRLSGIYHECDLVVSEALGAGLFSGLDPPALAALVSSFTYEARRSEQSAQFPSARLERRFEEIDDLARSLRSTERAAGLPRTRRPDAGFIHLAHEWAKGAEFGSLVMTRSGRESRDRDSGGISGGDFVRNVKQLVDLLRQIAAVEGESRLATSARRAVDSLLRGVVAVSSGVFTEPSVEVIDDPR